MKLENGSRQEIDAKTGRLDVLTFAEDTVDLASSGHGEDAQRLRDDSEMPLRDLLHPTDAVIARGDRGKYLMEAHRRLTQPLTTVGFTLVALLSVLTGGFRRAGSLWRPLASVLAMVGLLAVALTAQSFATRHPALIGLMWLQALAPTIICGWILFAPGVLGAVQAGRPEPAVPAT